jgi:hypothetical protein
MWSGKVSSLMGYSSCSLNTFGNQPLIQDPKSGNAFYSTPEATGG